MYFEKVQVEKKHNTGGGEKAEAETTI